MFPFFQVSRDPYPLSNLLPGAYTPSTLNWVLHPVDTQLTTDYLWETNSLLSHPGPYPRLLFYFPFVRVS